MFSMTDEQFNEVKAAKATLINLGYTYHGGEMWKPPLGQPPAYITWEGEGHPPVGALVKYRFSDAERWRYGKVKYITTRNAVLSDETGRDKWVECLDVYFRPYLSHWLEIGDDGRICLMSEGLRIPSYSPSHDDIFSNFWALKDN